MHKMTKYERDVCSRCRYSVSQGAGGSNVICNYMLMNVEEDPLKPSHRRPCKYYECVKYGIWKPKKRIRPKKIAQILEKYKDGTIE